MHGYSGILSTGFADNKDAARTIGTGFRNRILVSHEAREVTERHFLMDEGLNKGYLALL